MRRGGKGMLRAHWSRAISVPPSLSRDPSSPLSFPVFHLVFNASFPHPHSDLYRWMDCYPPPPTPPPNLPGSLLEFPAARQSLFSQVIAQGILIKVKICCWEVTFQTSCDFRCEIKWPDFPVSDKHPVTDEGHFKERIASPSLWNHAGPGGSVWFGSSYKQVGFYIWWIWERRLVPSPSQTAQIEVINVFNWENRVRARTSPDGHYISLALWSALRDGLPLDRADGIGIAARVLEKAQVAVALYVQKPWLQHFETTEGIHYWALKFRCSHQRVWKDSY